MTSLPAFGSIRTIATTTNKRLMESTIYTEHTIITKTGWKYRRN